MKWAEYALNAICLVFAFLAVLAIFLPLLPFFVGK